MAEGTWTHPTVSLVQSPVLSLTLVVIQSYSSGIIIPSPRVATLSQPLALSLPAASASPRLLPLRRLPPPTGNPLNPDIDTVPAPSPPPGLRHSFQQDLCGPPGLMLAPLARHGLQPGQHGESLPGLLESVGLNVQG